MARKEGAASLRSPGLRATFGWGAALLVSLAIVWPLSGQGSGVEETLRRLDGEVHAPRDLGGGLTLLRANAAGRVWNQAVGSARPIVQPSDSEFRALLRERCDDRIFHRLVEAGATVMEHHYGPDGMPVFSLRLTEGICGQVRMG
ncbi:hypothetical protein [Rubellimicrobium roseum]|uniref:Uncharacterized protein n=1 Tax=Rubellimicrobium roseum TaxID=687525 RepID=A0A5C4NBL8_9RHOB|nr:hypothetical protein [Rubellimicrobium roseum]TNC65029.1 hypothetical protein FHG71_18060 [Rubellimicrobium roseum]